MRMQILWQQDLSSKWQEVNPILPAGQIGLEKDTRMFKVGDGVRKYNQLSHSPSLMPEELVPGFVLYSVSHATNGESLIKSVKTFVKGLYVR